MSLVAIYNSIRLKKSVKSSLLQLTKKKVKWKIVEKA